MCVCVCSLRSIYRFGYAVGQRKLCKIYYSCWKWKREKEKKIILEQIIAMLGDWLIVDVWWYRRSRRSRRRRLGVHLGFAALPFQARIGWASTMFLFENAEKLRLTLEHEKTRGKKFLFLGSGGAKKYHRWKWKVSYGKTCSHSTAERITYNCIIDNFFFSSFGIWILNFIRGQWNIFILFYYVPSSLLSPNLSHNSTQRAAMHTKCKSYFATTERSEAEADAGTSRVGGFTFSIFREAIQKCFDSKWSRTRAGRETHRWDKVTLEKVRLQFNKLLCVPNL